jgi:hypothetical protein
LAFAPTDRGYQQFASATIFFVVHVETAEAVSLRSQTRARLYAKNSFGVCRTCNVAFCSQQKIGGHFILETKFTLEFIELN